MIYLCHKKDMTINVNPIKENSIIRDQFASQSTINEFIFSVALYYTA